MRCERLNHHLSFLRDCKNKDTIPKGLLLDKSINPMKSRDLGEFDAIKAQTQTIILQSSKYIVATLIDYYDQAVVVEHDFLVSLNDELTTLRLPLDEQSEMEEFAANVSLKQETIRTKLAKRRVTKIQKLLNPQAEKPESSKDNRPPKRKNKRKQKKQKNNKPNEGKDGQQLRDEDHGRHQPQQERNSGPAFNNNNNNRRNRPFRQYWHRRGGNRDNRGSQYRGRNWYGPYNGPRYFQGPASRREQDRDGNMPTQSNRNNETGGFQQPREGDSDTPLTASDLLRILSRAGVLRI